MPDYSFLADVELLIYDCDGVMTDNRVIVDQDGRESAVFNRGDGYGISRIRELGIEQVVISTEINPIVLKRCEKLGLEVINGVKEKDTAVKDYCAAIGIPLEKTMFIGNDLNDEGGMKAVGFRGCPRDAEPEIVKISDWISSRKGGEGVIRDLYRSISNTRVVICRYRMGSYML